MIKWVKITAGMFGMLTIIYMASLYVYYWDRTPEVLKIQSGSTQEFSLAIPANGLITEKDSWENIGSLRLDDAVTMIAGNVPKSYEVALRLYGVVPFKKVQIEVIKERELWPVGELYGFYLETQGVLVIGTGEFVNESGVLVRPTSNVIYAGDYLCVVNGEVIESKRQFQQIVTNSEGKKLVIEGYRDHVPFTAEVYPEKYVDGNYKLGIWIRDNAQGIGTVTYVDSDGNFGALGHAITDSDTEEILTIKEGKLYDSEILSIQKGNRNLVGEIHGLIDYKPDHIEGELLLNGENGIYGNSEMLYEKESVNSGIEVGMRQEIHKGKAYLISDVSGQTEKYEIMIRDYDMEDHSNQALTIEIVDPKLLSLTGGIIQGMSGCPILQDDKIIGAVTHVLISDSKKGYGIYIEDMLANQDT